MVNGGLRDASEAEDVLRKDQGTSREKDGKDDLESDPKGGKGWEEE